MNTSKLKKDTRAMMKDREVGVHGDVTFRREELLNRKRLQEKLKEKIHEFKRNRDPLPQSTPRDHQPIPRGRIIKGVKHHIIGYNGWD